MSERPQNRHLRPNPEALGVTPLREGELSRPVRVRAPTWVHEHLRSLGAAEIGLILTRHLQADED